MKRANLPILAFSLLALIIITNSCKSTKNATAGKELKILLCMMKGSFTSAEQEAQDSSYYNISLHMYSVWESREGHWFYVEQALFEMQDKPYRQRFYKVEQSGKNEFKTTVYSINIADEAVGKWKEPKWFDQFDESILEEREGCGVYLVKTALGNYQGSTKKGECQSSLRGASYATSKVIISEGQIYSWDRGFDAEDNQVWGAVKGGYIFKKVD